MNWQHWRCSLHPCVPKRRARDSLSTDTHFDMSVVTTQGRSSVFLSKAMHCLYWFSEASAFRSQVCISGTTLTTVLIARVFFSAVIESESVQDCRDFVINFQSKCWDEHL